MDVNSLYECARCGEMFEESELSAVPPDWDLLCNKCIADLDLEDEESEQ